MKLLPKINNVIIKTLHRLLNTLDNKTKEQLDFLATRYRNDSNMRLFYLFLENHDKFYNSFSKESNNADLLVFKGKSKKYKSFYFFANPILFKDEASSYIDMVLSGHSKFSDIKQQLKLNSGNSKSNDKNDL